MKIGRAAVAAVCREAVRITSVLVLLITLIGLMAVGGCAPGSYAALKILSIGRAVRPGDICVYSAIGVDQRGSSRVVTAAWSLSGDIGLLLNSEGATAQLLASKAGKGILTATKGKASGSLEIEVYSPQLTGMTITPSECTVYRNSTQAFTLVGYDQHKRPVPANPQWSVVGPIGSVSPETGTSVTLTTQNIGADGLLVATHGDVTAQAIVHVYPPEPIATSIYMFPDSGIVYLGDEYPFHAYVIDQGGNRISMALPSWRLIGDIGFCEPGPSEHSYFTSTALGKGKIVASYEGLEGYADIIVAEKASFSGFIMDSETKEPLADAEIRAYLEDGDDGFYLGSDISGKLGNWGFAFPVLPEYCRVILQAWKAGYFVRSISVGNASASDIQMRLLPDNLAGFTSFIAETSGSSLPALDVSEFQGFNILMENPADKSVLTAEQAEYLAFVLANEASGVGKMLGLGPFDVDVISGAHAHNPNEIDIMPDISLSTGTSSFARDGGLLATGGLIRICPTKATEWSLQRMLLHALAHVIYINDSTARGSILDEVYRDHNEFRPLDLKGAGIANEPTFRRMIDGKSVPDYLENILGPRMGLNHLAGY